jgi:hypothetical protein
MRRLRSIRRWTAFFMCGLVVSGLTAIPLRTEVGWAAAVLGEDFGGGGWVPPWAAAWFRTVRDAVDTTATGAPIVFYGTDWLAFGHVVVALAFLGALRDPVRNRWLFQFGMLACALVPVWAFVFGPLRGIPLWWRFIDAAFGIVGFVPMWLCHRWTAELEKAGVEGVPRARSA